MKLWARRLINLQALCYRGLLNGEELA